MPSRISQNQESAHAETRVTVFENKYAPGMAEDWRPRGETLADALRWAWPDDAHFAAYEPRTAPVVGTNKRAVLRLNSGEHTDKRTGEVRPAVYDVLDVLEPAQFVRMVALIGDVDDPVAHETKTPARDEWRAATLPKIEASGLAYYSTNGGYRVLMQTSFEIRTPEDSDRWKRLYLDWCAYLETTHGIVLDRACCDWTRLYRLPNVVRDGKEQRAAVHGTLEWFDVDTQWIDPGVAESVSVAKGPLAPAERIPSDLPEPSARVLELATESFQKRWLAGGRVAGNAWLHLCGWALARGWTKGELGALLVVLDEREPDAQKRREHWHILGNARAIDGPGGAKQWLDDDFARVDAIVARNLDAVRNALERRAANSNAPTAPEAHHVEYGGSAANAIPMILQARTDARHVLLWESADRGHQPVALGALRRRIVECRLNTIIQTGDESTDAKGNTRWKPFSAETIVERNGQTFGKAIYDFSRPASEYIAKKDCVVVGYPMRAIDARHDPDVDAWIRALGGDQYERLAQWIASCAQRHISRLAATLIILGDADVGKSLFADAVAGLWDADEPARAQLLIERFNGDLVRCPIVFDDEAELFGSAELSTRRFREVAQSTARSIERKGQEKFQLKGAMRLIVAANSQGDIRFTDVTGPEVVQAVGDRLCVIDAHERTDECKAALERLRKPEGYECDLERIVAHLAWIVESTELIRERFVGAGGGEDAILIGHVQEHPEVWKAFSEWLDGVAMATGPFFGHGGELLVNPHTAALIRGQYDIVAAQRALAPFKIGDRRTATIAGRPRLWALDVRRVMSALSLDDESGAELLRRLGGTKPTSQQPRDESGTFRPKLCPAVPRLPSPGPPSAQRGSGRK